jgi:hypothetical protein
MMVSQELADYYSNDTHFGMPDYFSELVKLTPGKPG